MRTSRPLPEGASLDAVTGAWPLGPGVLGGGLTRLGAGDIATFDAQGVPTGDAYVRRCRAGARVRAPPPLAVRRRPARRRGAGGDEPKSGDEERGERGVDLGLAFATGGRALPSTTGAGFGVDLGVAFEPRPASPSGSAPAIS